MTGRLDGKVALVTGGSRGMGAASIRRLHAEGAAVVAADILDDEGARYMHLDVTAELEWPGVVEASEREFGKLDVLVNNLSSTEGLGATVLCAGYTASKFAVRGITKVAALEHGHEGIRVNSIHPGGIDTPMTRAVTDDSARKYIASKTALKRMGSADDIADLVVFLASDESSYCTGAEFVIDGGATASAEF